MLYMKRALSTVAIAALIGAGTIAATTGIASARVVCNAEGDCWHTDAPPPRVPGIRFSLHPDDWYFHQHWDAGHHWRGRSCSMAGCGGYHGASMR